MKCDITIKDLEMDKVPDIGRALKDVSTVQVIKDTLRVYYEMGKKPDGMTGAQWKEVLAGMWAAFKTLGDDNGVQDEE
jgi:hypothetical protein